MPRRASVSPIARRVGLALCLLLAGCSTPLPPSAEWIEVASPHFTLLTDASAERALELSGELEAFRAVLVSTLGSAEDAHTVALRVIFFRDPGLRDRYTARGAVGQFLALPYEALLVAGDLDRRHHLDVLQHEYVHALLWRRGMRSPRWTEEGLAELWSTAIVAGANVDLGAPPGRHLALLRRLSPLPISRLIAMHDVLDSRRFYPQSWLALHYLRFGRPDGFRALRHFLSLRDEGLPQESAFERAFGALPAFDAALETWLRDGNFGRRRFSWQRPASTAEPSFRAVTQSEVLIALGRLGQATTAEDDFALRHFAAALEADPDSAAARVWLGIATARNGDRAAGNALAQQGLARASDSALLHSLYADLLSGRAGPTIANAGTALAERRRHYRRAVELDPELGEAHLGLAATYLAAEQDAAPGLAALSRAEALLPWREDAALIRARLLIRAARPGEAHAALEQVLHRSRHEAYRGHALQMMRGLTAPAVGSAPVE